MKLMAVKLITCMCLSMLKISDLTAQQNDETSIRKLLNRQVNAWNNGNIEEYMKGYRNDEKLIFVGKNGIRHGYAGTLASYRKGYPDTAAMGKLDFDLIELKRLSSVYYFVTGKWHLKRSIGDLRGYFTLLLKKIKNNWLIIADHSS